MAIVGTAFVRLRVIGDKLAADIGNQVKASVEKSSPQLEEAGASIGEKVGESISDGVQETARQQLNRVADDIGNAIGERMAQNMGRSLRRRAGDSLSRGLASARSGVSRAGDALQPIFDKIGAKWGASSAGGFRRMLTGGIVSGLAALVTIAPSALAFTGAIAGAVAASIIPAITAIGPAAAGAGLAAVAAFSSIKVSAKLVGLAMKYPTAALEDFQKRAETFKGLIAVPIQVGLLSGLNASMRLLSPMLRALEPQLTALGIAVGDLAIGFADAISQGVMFERITRILDTNNQFVRDAGGGVSQLGQAFIVLLDHLRPVTEFLGILVRDIGDWALRSILAAEATGQLDSFITRMFDSLRRFVGILVDFGIGIYNVFAAAQPAAEGMLTTLEDTGRKFREWTGDTANQDRMTTFFTNMRRISSEVYEILKDIGAAGLGGLENTNVDSVLRGLGTLRSLGPDLVRMFRDIQEAAGPQLADAFSSFADIIHELSESGVIGILSTAFANLLSVIAQLLAMPGVGTLLSFVAGLAVLGKTISFVFGAVGFLLRALRPILGILRLIGWAIGILVGAFGAIPVAIGIAVAALVGGLIYFFGFTERGRAILAAIWEGIRNAISMAVDGILAAWEWMVQAFQNAVDWISDLAQTIWAAVAEAFNAVVDIAVSTFTTVRDFIVGVWNAIWGFIQPILQGIWDFIVGVVSGIWTAIQFYLNLLWEFWSRIFIALMLPIRILYGVIILVWNEIYAFFQGIFTAIRDFVVTIWTAVYDWISGVMTQISDAITTGWNAAYDFMVGVLTAIRDWIVNTWNDIYGAVAGFLFGIYVAIYSRWVEARAFIEGVLDVIRDRISSVWNAVTGIIRGALNDAYGVVQNVWNNIVGFVQGAMDRIRNIAQGAWNALGDLGAGVMNGLKAALNVVIDGINVVINGINNAINAANNLPGPDIPTIGKIPRLAKGGTVSPIGGGTLAMIAEAGRPERVEPLDPSGLSRRDRALIDQLTRAGETNVTVYIGERELTEIVDVVVEDRESGLADRVLTGTKGR